MTWAQLLAERRVAIQPADRAEIQALRAVVQRNLADAQTRGLSTDGRYGHAYDAGRMLATLVVRASGYRVKGEGGGHYNTFLALKLAEPAFSSISIYLDACRRKRNEFLYEQANVVSSTEAEDLFMRMTLFSVQVDTWLKDHHPNLA
jgi:hypothetical protein